MARAHGSRDHGKHVQHSSRREVRRGVGRGEAPSQEAPKSPGASGGEKLRATGAEKRGDDEDEAIESAGAGRSVDGALHACQCEPVWWVFAMYFSGFWLYGPGCAFDSPLKRPQTRVGLNFPSTLNHKPSNEGRIDFALRGLVSMRGFAG